MPLVTLLDSAPESARRARLFTRSCLSFMAGNNAIESAVLVASELVTNAIIHGHIKDVLLEIEPVSGDEVRIEVWDDSVADPFIKDDQIINSEAESGRGMHIINVLASSWGVRHYSRGKSVYAYVPLHSYITERQKVS